MPKKNVWVTREDDAWGVRLEGSSRVLSRHSTQQEALGVGRDRAIGDKAELIRQGRRRPGQGPQASVEIPDVEPGRSATLDCFGIVGR